MSEMTLFSSSYGIVTRKRSKHLITCVCGVICHSESSELYRKISLMIYCDSFERYGVEVILLDYIIIGPLLRGGKGRPSVYTSI